MHEIHCAKENVKDLSKGREFVSGFKGCTKISVHYQLYGWHDERNHLHVALFWKFSTFYLKMNIHCNLYNVRIVVEQNFPKWYGFPFSNVMHNAEVQSYMLKNPLFVLFGGPEKGRLVRMCSMGK